LTGPAGATGATGPQGPIGLTGAAGPQGEQGPAGANGLSAYEIWLEQGNTGSEEDFINSLVNGSSQTIPNGVSNGDILFWNNNQWTNLPIGLGGQVLSINSITGLPEWSGSSVVRIMLDSIYLITPNSFRAAFQIEPNQIPPTELNAIISQANSPSIYNQSEAQGTIVSQNELSFVTEFQNLTHNSIYYFRGFTRNSLGYYQDEIYSVTTPDYPSIIGLSETDTIGDYIIATITNSTILNFENGGTFEILLVGGGQSCQGINGGSGAGAVYISSYEITSGVYPIIIGSSDSDSEFINLIARRGGVNQIIDGSISSLNGYEGGGGGIGTTSFSANAFNGGAGNSYPLPLPISYFQGGGGGGTRAGTPGAGGLGGGGNGNSRSSASGSNNAPPNFGGGGGGRGSFCTNQGCESCGAGGSGVLVLKWKFQ
jgi:hypothetical protein